MIGSQSSAFYNYFGKFRRFPVEYVFKNSDSGEINGSLSFFVYNNSYAYGIKQKTMNFHNVAMLSGRLLKLIKTN
jgi:hypothetical protein